MANMTPPFFCPKCGREVGYTYDAKTGLYRLMSAEGRAVLYSIDLLSINFQPRARHGHLRFSPDFDFIQMWERGRDARIRHARGHYRSGASKRVIRSESIRRTVHSDFHNKPRPSQRPQGCKSGRRQRNECPVNGLNSRIYLMTLGHLLSTSTVTNWRSTATVLLHLQNQLETGEPERADREGMPRMARTIQDAGSLSE